MHWPKCGIQPAGATRHSLLIAVCHILRHDKPYRGPGTVHTSRLNPQHYIRYHARKSQELGQRAELSLMPDAADSAPQPNFHSRTRRAGG